MNGRERVAAAMRHRAVDRVPVFCQLALGHYFLHAGPPPRDIWFTSEGFAEALVRLQRRYDFDGILVNLPGRPPDLWRRLQRIESADAGERLVWDDGSCTLVPSDDNPHHLGPGGNALSRASFESIDPEHLETLDALTGYVWNTYHIPWLPGKSDPGPLTHVPEYFLDTMDRVREKTRNAVSVHGEVFSPFTQYQELLGYEAALLSLATDPGKADALLERLTGAAIAWGVAQARRGADAVLVSSAFAGAGFISRRMYERFVLPHERRLNQAIRQTGVPVYTHTCGRIGDRLDLMEATGTQGIDTLDPPPLGNVTLADAKPQMGERLFLKGNLNAVALLEDETPADVDAAVCACLRDGSPGGGYILSTACSVAPRVAPWKLERFVPLACRAGSPIIS